MGFKKEFFLEYEYLSNPKIQFILKYIKWNWLKREISNYMVKRIIKKLERYNEYKENQQKINELLTWIDAEIQKIKGMAL